MFKDLFISYGRRESLGFVARLHQKLKLAGYDAWFDKVNIPDGEDYAARINHGIESAHNFVYVMAPRALCSPYCLVELEYARVLGKRVIPVNQMVIFRADDRELSAGEQQVLRDFYAAHGLPDPEIRTVQQVLDRNLAVVGRTDWLDGKEKLDADDCEQLAAWAQRYENYWHTHDDPAVLQKVEIPQFGESIDRLGSIVERVTLVLERHRGYVETHTGLLDQALAWWRNQLANHYLLVGKERQAAEDWLLTEFTAGDQPPCVPNALLCEFICESRKNGENMMSDCFVCHHPADSAVCDRVVAQLHRHGVTTWRRDRDIRSGETAGEAVAQGIVQADNLLYFMSPDAVNSEACAQELALAVRYHKRIVPLRVADSTEIPAAIQGLQAIDCQAAGPAMAGIAELLHTLRRNKDYHRQHKILLARAVKWQAENHKPSFLLRGHNLENAETWLRLNAERTRHPPTQLHRELIIASEAAKGSLSTEVFISYSRKDGDFARKLNLALQEAGKIVWFDQESIASGEDFEKELYKGIAGSDNFVFLISPDAVASEYCESEVNYAHSQGKRLLSVLCRPVDPQTLPDALRTVQWLDFVKQPFDHSFAGLIQAIDIDRDHARLHTALQQRALEWYNRDESQKREYLLNDSACSEAETWLQTARQGHKTPPPTALQKTFIARSKEALLVATRIRKARRFVMVTTSVFVVILSLAAAFAWWQMEEAVEARHKADQQRQLADEQRQVAETERNRADEQAAFAKALQLGNQAMVAAHVPSASNGFFDRALLLAAQGMKTSPSLETMGYLGSVFLAQPRILQYLRGHNAYVHSVAFSPDGLRLAAGGGDERILLWDLTQSLMAPQTLGTHDSAVKHLTFSPDGKLLATSGNGGELRLWDLTVSPPAGTLLPGCSGTVYSVAFSPDSRYLASGGNYGQVLVWNLDCSPDEAQRNPGGNPGFRCASSGLQPGYRALTDFSNTVYSLAFSPDGNLLAAGGSGEQLRVWDRAGNTGTDVQHGQLKAIYSVAFSPDGLLLASGGSDELVRLWAITPPSPQEEHPERRYEPIAELSGHSDAVYTLAFSPDGQRLVSGGKDKTLRIWDVAGQRLLEGPLYGHNNRVKAVAFSPDGQYLASAGYDQTVVLWDMRPRPNRGEVLGRQDGPIYNLALSPDGNTLAAVGADPQIRLWDIRTRQAWASPLRGHEQAVFTLAFSPRGNLLASAGFDNSVRLWDFNHALPPDEGGLERGGEKTGLPMGIPLSGHTSDVFALAFSPDGSILASAGGSGEIHLWDVANRTARGAPLQGHGSQVRNLQFSPDGKYLVSAGYDGKIIVWDVARRQPLLPPLEKHVGKIRALVFSPDGRFFASGGNDAKVWLWPLDDFRAIPLETFEDRISVLRFSPDSKYLAAADYEGLIKLWDITQPELIPSPLQGHNKAVDDLVFSPDGKMLASAGHDENIILWNVPGRMPIGQPLQGHVGRVRKLLFDRSGKTLLSAGSDGVILWWNLDPEDWIQYACHIAGRNLTKMEWRRYVGREDAYQGTCF